MTLAAAASAAPSATEQILQALKADENAKALAADPIANASRALERAQDARAAGDIRHAQMLAATAEEWAHVGQDLVRTAEVEARATKAERELADLEARLVRARALLEETMARRARASEKLEQLELPPADAGAEKP